MDTWRKSVLARRSHRHKDRKLEIVSVGGSYYCYWNGSRTEQNEMGEVAGSGSIGCVGFYRLLDFYLKKVGKPMEDCDPRAMI